MHDEIRTREQYLQEFEGLPSHREVRALALRFAWRARDHEIQSGWRRAAYFSGVIAVSYAGYFVLRSTGQPTHLVLLVTCIGFMASVAWYLVSRAANYWQENWERHAEALEDEVTGPLQKTVLAMDDFSLPQVGRGYPFSATRILQVFSLYIVMTWLFLAADALSPTELGTLSPKAVPLGVLASTAGFALWLILDARAGSRTQRRINFRKVTLEPTTESD